MLMHYASFCCGQLALHWRIVSWLLFGVLVFVVGGCVGTYFTLFGDVSLASNATVVAERVYNLGFEAAKNGGPPHTFWVWGAVSAGLYGFALLVYYVFACGQLWRRCSDRTRAWAQRQQKPLASFGQDDADEFNEDDEYDNIVASLRSVSGTESAHID